MKLKKSNAYAYQQIRHYRTKNLKIRQWKQSKLKQSREKV